MTTLRPVYCAACCALIIDKSVLYKRAAMLPVPTRQFASYCNAWLSTNMQALCLVRDLHAACTASKCMLPLARACAIDTVCGGDIMHHASAAGTVHLTTYRHVCQIPQRTHCRTTGSRHRLSMMTGCIPVSRLGLSPSPGHHHDNDESAE